MSEGVTGSVLVVDDDAALRRILERGLSTLGFRVRTAEDVAEVEPLLRAEDFDVVVTDLNLRRGTGLEVTQTVLDVRPGIPVIVITAFGSLEAAVNAIRAGAFDFLTKPFDLQVVAIAIERAIRFRRLNDDIKRLRAQANESARFHELVGKSPAMCRLYDLLERVRESDVSVLITGESGTGKELVARALHGTGRRSAGPFVAVNCAALPEPLLESELFGHVKGAFTDAKSTRSGLFVQAHGGTLFLDEVGELPAGMQPKLLRALQDRVVRPVGGDREVPFDARIVTATNRDLVSAVEAGTFREDLYFRLNVLEIEVPPLRIRGNDVLLLAQHFLDRAAASEGKAVRSIAPEAAKKLLAYRWAGNVRELQNCVERAVALCRLDAITPDDLPARVRDFAPVRAAAIPEDVDQLLSLEEVERRYILRVLDAVNGHRGHASKILKLDRKTLYRKLEAWGQDKNPEPMRFGS
jgi:two-component system response regulator HydG